MSFKPSVFFAAAYDFFFHRRIKHYCVQENGFPVCWCHWCTAHTCAHAPKEWQARKSQKKNTLFFRWPSQDGGSARPQCPMRCLQKLPQKYMFCKKCCEMYQNGVEMVSKHRLLGLVGVPTSQTWARQKTRCSLAGPEVFQRT